MVKLWFNRTKSRSWPGDDGRTTTRFLWICALLYAQVALENMNFTVLGKMYGAVHKGLLQYMLAFRSVDTCWLRTISCRFSCFIFPRLNSPWTTLRITGHAYGQGSDATPVP